MSNIEQQGAKKYPIQTLLVIAIVILFPLGSLFVNINGAKVGREFFKDLKNNFGQLPAFNAINWQNEPISSENYVKKVKVVSFTNSENKEMILNTLKPIVKTEQLRDEVENLIYLTFDNSQDSTFFKNYTQQFTQTDRRLWQILRGGADISTQIKLPDLYHIALVDSANVVRRYYDVRKEEDKRLLVEHISVMPIKVRAKLVKIQREER